MYSVPATAERRGGVSLLRVGFKKNFQYAIELGTVFWFTKGLSKNFYHALRTVKVSLLLLSNVVKRHLDYEPWLKDSNKACILTFSCKWVLLSNLVQLNFFIYLDKFGNTDKLQSKWSRVYYTYVGLIFSLWMMRKKRTRGIFMGFTTKLPSGNHYWLIGQSPLFP